VTHWRIAPLETLLAHSIGGVWGSPPGSEACEVRVLRVTELKGFGELHPQTAAHRSVSKAQLSSRRLLQDDLLLEKSGGGPNTPVGRVGLVPRLSEESVCSNFMQLMRPRADVADPRFLHLYLNHLHAMGATIPLQTASTNIRNIKLSNYAKLAVPVPEISEQRQIVAILEEHLSDLDDAASSLRRASARCQALVARSLSLVRSGNELPLPKVAVIQGGIQKQAKRAPRSNAFPFLRVANVTASGLDLGEVHQIELFNDELARYRLHAGDLLVVEGNGSPTQIGRAALWDGSIPDCVHQNHLIRVRPDREKILPEYLEAVWNSPENRSVLTHVASSSSGLHTLSVRKLAQLQIPVPSLARQIAAVSDLRQVRESVSRLQASISGSTARGESLRRAVLAAAFAGRLTGHGADTEVVEELAEEESA
jgi:type I restriction enzyme, S subunit